MEQPADTFKISINLEADSYGWMSAVEITSTSDEHTVAYLDADECEALGNWLIAHAKRIRAKKP